MKNQLPPTVTSTHQRRDVIGPKTGKDITSHTPRPSGWDTPRSTGAIRTGAPRTTRGQTLSPAGTQGRCRHSTTQKQDSRARSRSYPRHCHRASHPRLRASGGNGRDKGTRGLCGTSCKGRLLGVLAAGCGWGAAPGAAKADRLLGGRGRQCKENKGGKGVSPTRNKKIPRPHAPSESGVKVTHSSVRFAVRPEGGA